ncbi:hypothetical protein D9613_007428 [Agrocybe pediades]|uniref:Uncharacterized protein n=1 Tax=Agrocybe pediades TaxID=84607 RepID=A0A8H4QLZ3_9AGAR|nr:hypothetical protein D9613_007428 [Agrocybe pediades]
MLFELFREQITKLFPILSPAFSLLHERVNVLPASGLEVSATSFPALVQRYGRPQVAVLCTMVEVMAFFGLLFNYGVHDYVDSTLSLLGSRSWLVFDAFYVYLVNCLYLVGMNTAIYLKDTAVGHYALQMKEPGFRVAGLIHSILMLHLGNDYLFLSIDYLKALPSRIGDYALCRATQVYSPCKERLEEAKRSSYFVSFVCRRIFELFALLVLYASVLFVFLFIYAMDESVSQFTVYDEESHGRALSHGMEEVDNVDDATESLTLAVRVDSITISNASDPTESEDTVLKDLTSAVKAPLDAVSEEGLKEEITAEEVPDEDAFQDCLVEGGDVEEQVVVQGSLEAHSQDGSDAGSVQVCGEDERCDAPEESEVLEVKQHETDSGAKEEVEEDFAGVEEVEEEVGDEDAAGCEEACLEEPEPEPEPENGEELCDEQVEKAELDGLSVTQDDPDEQEVSSNGFEDTRRVQPSTSTRESIFSADDSLPLDGGDFGESDNLLDIDLNEVQQLSHRALEDVEDSDEEVHVSIANVSWVSSTIEHANVGRILTIETREVLININTGTSVGSEEYRWDDPDYLSVGPGSECESEIGGEAAVAAEEEEQEEQGQEEDDHDEEEQQEVVIEEVEEHSWQEQLEVIMEEEEEEVVEESFSVVVEEHGAAMEAHGSEMGLEELGGNVAYGNAVVSPSWASGTGRGLIAEASTFSDTEGLLAIQEAEAKAERERLVKQRAREMMMGMSSWQMFGEEEKALVLGDSMESEKRSAQKAEAQEEPPASTSSVVASSLAEEASVPVDKEAEVAAVPGAVEEDHIASAMFAAMSDGLFEVKDLSMVEGEEDDRADLMFVKSPRLGPRTRASSLDALVGMQAAPRFFGLEELQNGGPVSRLAPFSLAPTFNLPRFADAYPAAFEGSALDRAALPAVPVPVEGRRRRNKSLPL